MKKLRWLSGLLALLLLVSVGAFAQGEVLKVRFAIPGTEPDDVATGTAAVNEKLAADGMNLEFEPIYIPWDAWSQRTNMMLSSGEPFELMHVMQDQIPLATYTSRGAFEPLNDLLKEYGENIPPMFEDYVWDTFTQGEDIMSVPAQWLVDTQTGFTHGPLGIRKDLLRKFDLEEPTTLEELIATMEVFRENWEGKTAYMWEQNPHNAPVWLHRTYASWPFYVGNNGLFMVDQEGGVSAYIESEEFKQDAAVYRDFYQRGWIHPDVLSLPNDYYTAEMEAGNALLGFGLFDGRYDEFAKRQNPEWEVGQFFLAPEQPILQHFGTGNSNAVPVTTDHPEAGIRFLSWLYSDPANLYLLTYGVEGTHYKMVGDNRIEQVLNSAGKPVYDFQWWQVGYYQDQLFRIEIPDEWVELTTVPAANLVVSPVMGFGFDPTPVDADYSNVVAEYTRSILPIKMGVVDYDTEYEAALARMKAAGLDAVVAEYQRQLSEYLASK